MARQDTYYIYKHKGLIEHRIRQVFLWIPFVLLFGAGEARADMKYQGVNISGGEFNLTTVPGVYNTNYVYPNNEQLDYFSSKGLNTVRVPFSWERMQQTPNGALDPTELGRLDTVVNAATQRGMSTVLDPHNYGAYHNVTVGTPGGRPNSMFADFWRRMAEHYKGNPKVIFGLMNEPIGSNMTAETWLASAQAAIDAIRATGAQNMILIPSTYWSHPNNFLEVNASVMINVADPGNNWAYDMHQYLDFDGSGTHTDYLNETDAVGTLTAFTEWCKTHNRKAFLTEIGVTSDPGACASLAAMLQYMHANSSVWSGYTYWTAGAWYPDNYIFLIEPRHGTDTPQMVTLMNNLGNNNEDPDPEPDPEPEPPPTDPPPTDPPSTDPPPTDPPPTDPPPSDPPPSDPPPSEPPPSTDPPKNPRFPKRPKNPRGPKNPRPRPPKQPKWPGWFSDASKALHSQSRIACTEKTDCEDTRGEVRA